MPTAVCININTKLNIKDHVLLTANTIYKLINKLYVD